MSNMLHAQPHIIGESSGLDSMADMLREMSLPDVEKVDTLTSKKIRHGQLVCRKVCMSDGSRYDVKSLEPDKRTTDVGVTMTTPWLTEPKGYNCHMAMTLMRQGYPVDLVSAERHLELLPSLHKSAQNQLAITRYTSEKHQRNDKKAIAVGVSRGAMIGFSLTAQADKHNFDIVYGDYIVPGFPRSIIDKRQFNSYLQLPKLEAATLPHILKLPLRTLLHYPSTFSHSPKAMINHIAAIYPLVNGSAGESAKKVPNNHHGTVVAFRGDMLSQGEYWEEIFTKKSYPYMDVVLSEGAHLSCASHTTIEAFKERMKKVLSELHDNKL
jgi:hypothetical protein